MTEEVTAYHEAGHVYLAARVGATVRSVTIESDWDDGPRRFGDTQVEWDSSRFTPADYLRNLATVALAGPAAEMVYRGEPFHPATVVEWSADWTAARGAVEQLLSSEEKQMALLEQLSIELYRLMNRDSVWAAVAAIADELIAHETLEGEQIIEILEEWPS